MKQFFSLLLIVFFVSCKKESLTQAESIPAQSISDVSYGSDAVQKMDLYLPAGRNPDTTRLIVLVHGGAWSSGDKSEFSAFFPEIQKRFPGYAIANINYRLATTTANRFPTQENDMKAAVDFLIQKSAEYKVSQNLVLLGASAGAHMVLLQAYKYSSPKIKAVVDFFGPTDMKELYNFYGAGSISQLAVQILMNGTPSSNTGLFEQSSPVSFVTAQSPPTIIFHGNADVVVPVAQSTALKNKLASLGVPHQLVTYPNLGHDVWPAATMMDVFNKMEAFLKANVH